jgi:Zn-dependent protease
MARQLDMVVKNVVILPVGGLVQIETRPEQPLSDLLIALAGPLANLALATGAALLLWFLRQTGFFLGFMTSPDPVLAALTQSGRPQEFLIAAAVFLLAINTILFVFNLIPAFPLDGGRIVRALLATLIAYDRATQLTRWLGQGMAVLLLVAAFSFNSLGLFFLGGLILVTGITMKVSS